MIRDGLRLLGLELRGKTVLLKVNLVEYIPGAGVNPNSLVVRAAADAFLALGAKTVVVAEGPGNQRDTYLVLAQSGFESQLRDRKLNFVDLNRDDVRQVKVTTPFTGLDSLWIPQSILAADFVVSMPKVKTHHWAGVTLSLKNRFGTIPGSVYGWPKNILHWKGIGRSIVDISSTIPAHFVIADGIVAMEGNGPLQGTTRELGRIVMSDEAVAADFPCARLMGFDPYMDLSPGAGPPVSRRWGYAAHRPVGSGIATDRASVFGFARVRSLIAGDRSQWGETGLGYEFMEMALRLRTVMDEIDILFPTPCRLTAANPRVGVFQPSGLIHRPSILGQKARQSAGSVTGLSFKNERAEGIDGPRKEKFDER